MKKILVGVVMGSESDRKVMDHASRTLSELGIAHTTDVISVHRNLDRVLEWTGNFCGRVVVAGAGGAAHLPGIIAARLDVPVLGVPIPCTTLAGMDALLSIVQMPAGTPVATFSIGEPGAINAAIFAARILLYDDHEIDEAYLARKRRKS